MVSHTCISGISRRLRFHIFFHQLQNKVSNFVKDSSECAAFSGKKSLQPFKAYEVTTKCWEDVAVDLFGPIPLQNHVVVVTDMASRYSAVKVVRSTKASQVIPALNDIYDSYGNPSNQLSDKGASFNFEDMATFAKRRDINLKKIPPGHPEANSSEIFMKPLGKAMKIGHSKQQTETIVLKQLLQNYRDNQTPS